VRLLLDTHAYIWCAFDPGKLSPSAVEALAQPASVLYVSTASLWEIAVKSALGKLTLPLSLREMVEKLRQGSGVVTLPVAEAHVFAHERLGDAHRDPFDRMLVAQAIAEDLAIVTRDPLIRQYGVATVW
jgi:PIN domain nuclease of toxin-antitoxin system